MSLTLTALMLEYLFGIIETYPKAKVRISNLPIKEEVDAQA